MSTEVANTTGQKGLTLKVPPHLAAMLKAKGMKNIADKTTVNSLTFAGKAWTMHINGDKKLVQKTNEDGELENVQILRVIVLDTAPQGNARGRSYYEGLYDPANVKAPDCWSKDGKRPDISIADPKAKSCDLCPMAAKGSRVVQGKEMVACQTHKLLAVVPAANPKFPVMRLKVGPTSLFDKQDQASADAGWFGWENYCDLLRSNGLDFTGSVVTKIRFANVEYPKLQFALHEFLEPEQAEAMWARHQTEEVTRILAGFTPVEPASLPPQRPMPKDEPEVDGPAPTGPSDPSERRDQAVAALHAAEVEKAKAAAAQAAEVEKTKKIAEAKALLASLEGGTPPVETAAQAEVRHRTRRTKAEMEAARAAEAAAKAPANPTPSPSGVTTGSATQSTVNSSSDDGNWDEPAAPATKPLEDTVMPPETEMPTRETKPAVITPVAPVEVPSALANILDGWS